MKGCIGGKHGDMGLTAHQDIQCSRVMHDNLASKLSARYQALILALRDEL